MASNNELPTDMDYQNASLPLSGKSTPERPIGQTSCAKLEATKADIRRYTLIVQGFENMITTLKQSNAQDVNTTPPLLRWSNNAPIMKIYLIKRNIFNAKIFELKKVSLMNVTVDGYDGKRVTQCYSCNRFHHTAENCHITPRCLKCGDAHQTRECEIERDEKPYCINCETYGHMANYSDCPKFPKPRKGSQEKTNTYTNTVNSIVRPGTSYSQAASASNSTKTQQMAPQVKGNPAALLTNQANQSTLPTPLQSISTTTERLT
ncbi:nucleic-acid-binding protein from transposon X-element [Trichonephila clavipes]|nr:nucleic-acid-binding protein from transposon X-element [Trichonephila clavipes]